MLLALALLLQTAPAALPPPPELTAAVYQARRERVMKELGGCMALLTTRGAEQGDDYRADGDFLWLTGVDEPGAWLVLAPKMKYDRVVLALRPRDPEQERWTGPRDAITPALKAKHGVDKVYRGRPDRYLVSAGMVSDCITVITAPVSLENPPADVKMAQTLASNLGLRLEQKRGLVASLRAAHGPDELPLLEHAVAITRRGHEAAARHTVAGMQEREVQREIEYAFSAAGGTGLAYGTIVGSGPNGAVLHWDYNTRKLRDGDVVVVDAGAEYRRYAADITRTYPVGGRFNEEQAKAYRAVYQAQEDVFAAIKPGVSFAELQRVAEKSLEKSGYLEHFIHSLGHFVGLDVHDAGSYEAPLPVGAVFTVEPGVYMPEKGFGIRIEDEVVITPDGYRLLSADIPRKLEDVEAWVARARRTAR
jgi:Xaa-Pro aminopeptidase